MGTSLRTALPCHAAAVAARSVQCHVSGVIERGPACAMAVTLHTSHGEMKVEIFCDAVPRTCFNFLALASSGYYDGTPFHRNVRGFMLQGGDPTGTGERSTVFFSPWRAGRIARRAHA